MKTLWVHISPKNSKNKHITYLPVVVYEEKGKPPIIVRVLKQRMNNAKNQYNILMDNIEFAIRALMDDKDVKQIEGAYKLIFVSNNQALVSWFQKGNCPLNYKDQFLRIVTGLRKLPVGSVGITNDVSCLADKYCSESYVTKSIVDEADEEEEYINIVEICGEH